MGASNSSIGGVGVGSERVGTCECRRYLIERKDLSGRPTEKIDRPEPDASGMIGMTGASLVPSGSASSLISAIVMRRSMIRFRRNSILSKFKFLSIKIRGLAPMLMPTASNKRLLLRVTKK